MITIKWILLIALFKCSHQQSTNSAALDAWLNKSTTRPSRRRTSTESTTTTIKATTQSITTTNNAAFTGEVVGCSGNRECVRFFNCNNGSLITDGDGVIDLRADTNRECSHYLDVCCSKENKSETPTITTKPITGKCGASNPNGVGFKVQQTFEHEAQFGEFPWMVAVLRKEKVFGRDQNMYHCGGSLIHPSAVLTIGHKVVDVNPLRLFVRAGEWDTDTTNEPFPFVESNVVSIDIHPRFHATTHNIGIIFLETAIMNAPHINTICLPPPHMNFDGQRCFVSGWGTNSISKEASYQHILKKVDMTVLDHEKCTEMFRKTRLGKHYILNESLICAGGEPGKDTCKGDGGSPLVCPIPGNEGHFYQAGIVAWGIGCGEDGTPGAYTKVALFGDWIEEKLQIKGYSSSSYTL